MNIFLLMLKLIQNILQENKFFYVIHTFLLMYVIPPVSTGTVDVSTTISGSTIISCDDEYCDGSSVIVVKEISEGTLGYIRRLLRVVRTGTFFLDFGEDSGEGISILSWFSPFGLTSPLGPQIESRTGSSTKPLSNPITTNAANTTKKYLKNTK